MRDWVRSWTRTQASGMHATMRTPPPTMDWNVLGPRLRDRFDGSVPHLLFRCDEVRTDGTAGGCYLIRFMRLLGTRFPAPGEHRAATIDVDVIDEGVRSWCRTYVAPGGRTLRLDTVKTEKGDVIEERSGLLAIMLRREAREDRLTLTSERFDVVIGRIRLAIPRVLTPGRLIVEHRHETDGSFTFDMRLNSPCFGDVFVHRGRFDDVRRPMHREIDEEKRQ